MTPQELQQYITQYNTALTPGGASAGTTAYQNSPAYNLQFGPAASQTWNNNPVLSLLSEPKLSTNEFLNSDAYKIQYGNNNSQDPNERFQNDPGIQMAIKAGMPMLANSYAAKGMGASGPAANAVGQYMYNNYLNFTGKQGDLYNTEYNNRLQQQQQNVGTYLNQQQVLGNSFANYQNQLGTLAGAGNTASGQQGQTTANANIGLGNLLAQLQYGTGGQLSSNLLSSQANVAQLQANNGVFNANAYLGIGAAMSNNMMQGSQLGAQLANAQNVSNAQTASSAQQGLGAMYGMQQGQSYNTTPITSYGNPWRTF